MAKIQIPERKAPRKLAHQSTRPIICVDFDGVIYQAPAGYSGPMTSPMPEAITAMQQLNLRYDVVIYTLRANSDVTYLEDWLRLYDIPFAAITDTKVPGAVAYVDDKAIRHTNWINTMMELGRLGL